MPNSNRREQKTTKNEVIDVDEFYKHYEDTGGFVQCSTVQEFRKAWRSVHKEKGVERTRSRSSAESSQTRQIQRQQSGSSQSASLAGDVGVGAVGGQKRKHIRQVRNTSMEEGGFTSREAVRDDIDLPSSLGCSAQRERLVSPLMIGINRGLMSENDSKSLGNMYIQPP